MKKELLFILSLCLGGTNLYSQCNLENDFYANLCNVTLDSKKALSAKKEIVKTENKMTYSNFELDQFAGTYYSEETNEAFEFYRNENGLIDTSFVLTTPVLIPIQEDYFETIECAYTHVEFIRNKEHKIIGFHVNDEMVRNIFFEKIK